MKKLFGKSISWILSVAMLLGLFLIVNVQGINANAASTIYWPLPTDKNITRGYSSSHDGADFACAGGTPIYATFDGTAVYYQVYTNIGGTNYLTSYGNCVYLTSSDGTYWSVFAHMSSFEGFGLQIPSSQTRQQSGSSGKITIGSRKVSEGDILGYVGTTGNSTGNHLHFGLKVNGNVVNPASYLNQTQSAFEHKNNTPVPHVDPTPTPPTPVPAQQDDTNIKYAIDFICGGENSISIQGWAFDGDDTSQALWIHVYIGGVVGDPNAEGHAIMANQSRQDVNNVHHCGDNHGFSEKIQTNKTGDQPVYVYAINVGNGSINPCIGSFNVPISVATPHDNSPAVFNPTLSKVSRNGYRVSCNINTTIGISRVLFPTWTEVNGQDDLIYHEGTIFGNTANVYINTSEHNNEIGTYITHIYALDQNGNTLGVEGVGIVLRNDNEPYPLREAHYNGHRYVMYLADMSWTNAQNWCNNHGGYLATVTSEEEWNTIKWMVTFDHAPCFWLGAENTTGSWKWVTGEPFTYTDWCPGEPNCADGNEFYLGTYEGTWINAYRWNDFPNNAEQVGCFIFEEPLDKTPPTVTNPTISRVSSKGYQVTCNISDDHGVKKVLFPTWTDKNGQDDVIYYEGTISENTATVYIPTSEHNNEKGFYHTHIYAYDAEGNSGFAGTSCNIIDDEPYEIKSTEYNNHVYTMYLADMSWTEAQAWCEKNGGYLATVTSQEEWDTIKCLVAHNNAPCCWLGAESASGSWKWVTGEDFTYTDWRPGEPNGAYANEFYLGTYEGTLINAYRWNDFPNSTDLVGCFVMEKTNIIPLENNSTLSSETIKLGEQITATGKAVGGTGEYLYNVLYKQKSQSKWTTAQSYKSNDTVTFKPASATTYDVCVKVKDGNNTEVKKFFTINVTSDELKNTSTISATTINLGESVNINAKATGSTGFYTYAVYYKKTSESKWTTKQDFKANNKVTVEPKNSATYDICVKVKDDKGTIDKKYFTVNVVSNELKNVSTVSAETINIGESVTVNANATGSTGFYTYAVYYKQETQTKWTTAQAFKANNKITVKPTKATTYDICVKVKDDKGTIVKEYFKVNVTDFKNTPTISATEITLGKTVKVSCLATGSTGFYQYAVYYKKTSDTKWTTKQNYSANNTVTVKPTEVATYDICVKVKDNQNNVVKKYFTVTVK